MKLSYKTLQLYLICCGITFGLSVPVFYLLVQRLWIHDVDESLRYQKELIEQGILRNQLEPGEIARFNELAGHLGLNISLTPLSAHGIGKDSIYYGNIVNPVSGQQETARILSSGMQVQGVPMCIQVHHALLETSDLIRGIVLVQAILFLCLLAATVWVNSYFSKKIWKPFYGLLSQLQAFRLDKGQAVRMEKSPVLEFNSLHDSIQKLIDTNVHIFTAQKEFTENAAHETRNSLTAIQNQVELAAQDDKLSARQAAVLTRIDDNIRHLTKLNRDLLLLSRIESNRFDSRETVDMNDFLREICADFGEQLEVLGISLETALSARPELLSNRLLLRSLVVNLFSNALKHNVPGGRIDLELGGDYFRITNTGSSGALKPDRIFERFYRQSDKSESTGLGLAIVKRICRLLELKIDYRFESPDRHAFRVRFTPKGRVSG
ncbi:MAG: HAMP domain-containing sensor histidine kinase [Solitalea sp.]